MSERQMQQTIAAIVLLSMIGIAPGLAQEPPNDLPPIDVFGHRPAKSDDCGQKRGAHQPDCLNRRMERQVDRVNPPAISAPLGANSADTKIGIVNLPAVQQQYGQNYGKSVVPYRPLPMIYAPALGHH